MLADFSLLNEKRVQNRTSERLQTPGSHTAQDASTKGSSVHIFKRSHTKHSNPNLDRVWWTGLKIVVNLSKFKAQSTMGEIRSSTKLLFEIRGS